MEGLLKGEFGLSRKRILGHSSRNGPKRAHRMLAESSFDVHFNYSRIISPSLSVTVSVSLTLPWAAYIYRNILQSTHRTTLPVIISSELWISQKYGIIFFFIFIKRYLKNWCWKFSLIKYTGLCCKKVMFTRIKRIMS